MKIVSDLLNKAYDQAHELAKHKTFETDEDKEAFIEYNVSNLMQEWLELPRDTHFS